MRIAQILPTLGVGGAENLALGYGEAMARRGHQSHLIILDAAGGFRDRLPPGVPSHDLGFRIRGDSLGLGDISAMMTAWNAARGILARERIGVLVTHLPLGNYFGLGLTFGGSPRFYPFLHNNREFAYGAAPGRLRLGLRKSAYRAMVSRSGAVVAVSDQVRTSFAEDMGLGHAHRNRIVVVPNGVPLRPAPDPDTRRSLRTSLGFQGNELMILGVGRLTEQKNFGELITALAGIRGTEAPWRCVIAGDGPLRGELEQAIRESGLEDRVSLTGAVDNIPDYMACADLFCMPSVWEGLPLALLEAMGAGLPVVAADIPGIRDIVKSDSEALLYSPGDAAGLTGLLVRVFRDRDLRLALGAAGRDMVARHHDFEKSVDILENLLCRSGAEGYNSEQA